MSTIYAILKKGLAVSSFDGCADTECLESGPDYMEIGSTRSFKEGLGALISNLPDDTPVFATDNDTDIKTLGELKQYYAKWRAEN